MKYLECVCVSVVFPAGFLEFWMRMKFGEGLGLMTVEEGTVVSP